jgi:hypothetical protein
MFYAQDSGAGSMLARWDGLDRSVDRPSARHRGSNIARACTQWLYGQGYSRHRSKVLVIGLGGGPDLQCALYHRARSVDAVEINPDSIRVVRETFSDWLGGVGDDDRVRFHNRDGRSFAHSSRGEGYDLIQMTGADTKHALASGGLAISENHLYTREAFVDYLESLAPDGVLSIVRFGEIDAFRLANTASAALRELGSDAPHRHMAVFAHGDLSGVLVRRTPFPPGELAALERHLRPPYQGGLRIFFYEVFDLHQQPARVLYLPERRHGEDDERFAAFFAQMAEGSTAPFAAAYAFDISPTDDDRPFFFDVDLYDETVLWSGAPHVVAIRNLLIATFALSIALILLPLRRMRERLHGRHAAAVPCTSRAWASPTCWSRSG